MTLQERAATLAEDWRILAKYRCGGPCSLTLDAGRMRSLARGIIICRLAEHCQDHGITTVEAAQDTAIARDNCLEVPEIEKALSWAAEE